MSQEKAEIYAAIPHREPFLFVDKVLERNDEKIVTERTFTEDEYFFAGHYPGSPIVPGVILCEAAMQSGAILLAEKLQKVETVDGEAVVKKKLPVVVKMTDIRFRQVVRPGDTVRMTAELEFHTSMAYQMKASIMLGDLLAANLKFVVMVVQDKNEDKN